MVLMRVCNFGRRGLVALIVWIGLRISRKTLDGKFHFGYYRVETFSSIIAALFIARSEHSTDSMLLPETVKAPCLIMSKRAQPKFFNNTDLFLNTVAKVKVVITRKARDTILGNSGIVVTLNLWIFPSKAQM
jgi:hypothetical protein